MSCKFICDGCGKEAPAWWSGHEYEKPPTWYLRADEDGPQVACSRECIDQIAASTGKTRVVLPF